MADSRIINDPVFVAKSFFSRCFIVPLKRENLAIDCLGSLSAKTLTSIRLRILLFN